MSDTNTIIQLAPNQYQAMLDNYASVVEKTNSQLGLWTNPYGLMVGILTLLVAVGAVIVAYLLWKNSKDQKEITKEFFINQEKLIKKKNEREERIMKERREEVKKELDKLISEQQEKLESAKTENKKEIEKFINELKREKASAGAYLPPDPFIQFSPTRVGNLASYEKSMICSKCGKVFKYNVSDSMIVTTVLDPVAVPKLVYCSYCGEANVPK